VFGIVVGILCSILTLCLVPVTPELAHDPSGGVIVVFMFILCGPLLAGAFWSIYGAFLGIALEALVKTFEVRPAEEADIISHPGAKENHHEPPADA
jgi:hypothetical protein